MEEETPETAYPQANQVVCYTRTPFGFEASKSRPKQPSKPIVLHPAQTDKKTGRLGDSTDRSFLERHGESVKQTSTTTAPHAHSRRLRVWSSRAQSEYLARAGTRTCLLRIDPLCHWSVDSSDGSLTDRIHDGPYEARGRDSRDGCAYKGRPEEAATSGAYGAYHFEDASSVKIVVCRRRAIIKRDH